MFRLREAGCVKMWMRMGGCNAEIRVRFRSKSLRVWVVSGFQLLSKVLGYPSKWGIVVFGSSSRLGCVGFVKESCWWCVEELR